MIRKPTLLNERGISEQWTMTVNRSVRCPAISYMKMWRCSVIMSISLAFMLIPVRSVPVPSSISTKRSSHCVDRLLERNESNSTDILRARTPSSTNKILDRIESTELMVPERSNITSKGKPVVVAASKPPNTNGPNTSNLAIEKKTRKLPLHSGQESSTLRRIKREWKDAVEMGIAYDWVKMRNVGRANTDERNSYVRIGPYGGNLLKWHFSVAGSPSSEYDSGIFHGRVLLPKDYPGSPPRVQVLTPSGRFIPGHDICLSASNYHPESWTPKWTVMSLVDALRLHMLTQANEIGGMSATPAERRKLALASRSWSLGSISHEKMIAQGIFGEESETARLSGHLDRGTAKPDEEDIEVGMHLASIRSHDVAHVADRLTKDRGLALQVTKAAAEIIKSPHRMMLVVLIALFLMLNLNP